MGLVMVSTKTLAENGCQLADPPHLFEALLLETRGDPCKTGCMYFQEGSCIAYQRFHTDAIQYRRQKEADLQRARTDQSGLIGGKWAGVPIKQIAEMEGISLSEARRRKQAGMYKD